MHGHCAYHEVKACTQGSLGNICTDSLNLAAQLLLGGECSKHGFRGVNCYDLIHPGRDVRTDQTCASTEIQHIHPVI